MSKVAVDVVLFFICIKKTERRVYLLKKLLYRVVREVKQKIQNYNGAEYEKRFII